MDKSKIMYKVKNRSASRVVYKDPELKVRREFQPGETKLISYEELEKLTYIPGGRNLMANFLQLEPQAVQEIGVPTEPEYFMSEEQVKDLLLNGSVDAFLDCLDFAPAGVIDLVKQLAIVLPLTDIQKRRALKDKIGFDVDAAIKHMEEEQAEMKQTAETQRTGRRVPIATSEPVATTRRTTVSYVEEPETAEEVETVEKAPKKRGRPPMNRDVKVVEEAEINAE